MPTFIFAALADNSRTGCVGSTRVDLAGVTAISVVRSTVRRTTCGIDTRRPLAAAVFRYGGVTCQYRMSSRLLHWEEGHSKVWIPGYGNCCVQSSCLQLQAQYPQRSHHVECEGTKSTSITVMLERVADRSEPSGSDHPRLIDPGVVEPLCALPEGMRNLSQPSSLSLGIQEECDMLQNRSRD